MKDDGRNRTVASLQHIYVWSLIRLIFVIIVAAIATCGIEAYDWLCDGNMPGILGWMNAVDSIWPLR